MRTAVLKMQNIEREGLRGKRNFVSQKDIVEISRPGRQRGQSAIFVDWSGNYHLYICMYSCRMSNQQQLVGTTVPSPKIILSRSQPKVGMMGVAI
jgi:hypothetical protein